MSRVFSVFVLTKEVIKNIQISVVESESKIEKPTKDKVKK